MRITFLLPHAGLAGGVRVVAIYARLLQQRGHRVAILSTPYVPPGIRGKIENLQHRLGLWMRGEKDPSHLNGIERYGVVHRRLRSLDHLDAAHVPDSDVIVATWWETAERLAALPPRKGAHAYFIQHYEVHESQPIDRVKATWRLRMQKIVVARWLAEIARGEHGDPGALVVPNAVDLEQFSAPPRGKSRPTRIGMMYSSQRYKGSDICVRAVELARRTVPDLQLSAFGMAEFATQTNLPPDTQYFMLPEQEKIKDIYSACDAWLFGSRSEGFGLPILEAMACRTPVIATPAGAAPELVAGGGGLLVPPEDPQSMAEAIIRVAQMSEAEWKQMSDAAHATATRYTWNDATDLFEAGLRRAMESLASTGVTATKLTAPVVTVVGAS